MIRKLLAPIFIVTLILWTGGCSESPTEPASGNLNLEDEFGGYSASPESPGFGNPDLVDEAEGDVEYEDEILASPETDSIISCPATGYYHLRVIWGRLCYDSSVTEITDWTGALTVSRGVEVIRRVIRFEPGQDYILPRTDRRLIEWVSKTTVHNDGIAVDIFVPRLLPVFDTTEVLVVDSVGDTSFTVVVDTIFPEPVPATVTFETGPYSRTFDLEELTSLDTIIYLDDSNAVAFHAFRLHRYPCPRGFLAGRWGFDENGKGRFRGVWMTNWGRITGYLKGHFGKNSAGVNVFFGKWISRNGQFEGFLRGTYGHIPGPNANVNDTARKHARGWFAGRIYNANRDPIGILKGKYRAAPRFQNGFFQGRWKLFCKAVGIELINEEEGF